MKWNWRDTLSLCILFGITVVFFLRLFFPFSQLIITPDFGRSDAWSFSFTTKYILSENLKSGNIPLWNKLIGDGFPLLAEGQIGTFFLPNLLLFKYLDPVSAYNSALALTVFTAMVGMYLWAKAESISRTIALFSAILFGFSGIIIPHLTHITLLQSFTLLPILMAIVVLWSHQQKPIYPLLFALIASQQFLAGFPQASFITMIFTTSYFIWRIWPNQTGRGKTIGIYGITLLWSGILSCIQLFPSREFLSNLLEPNGFQNSIASYFSFPLANIATLVHPFILGNVRDGTYAGGPGLGNIFWENNAYIGIVPLVFTFVTFVSRRIVLRKKIFFGAVLLIAILLANGKYSPLYFIYSVWPFNLFRVPSRFIWILVPTMILLSAYGAQIIVERIKAHRYIQPLFYIILGVIVCDMIYTWWPYHATAQASTLITAPKLTHYIRPDDHIVPLAYKEQYSLYFMRAGWKTRDVYAFHNLLLPNGNSIWNIASHDAAVGRTLRRSNILDSLIDEQLQVDSTVATLSATGKKLLDITGVNVIISPVTIDNPNLIAEATISSNTSTITLYRNPDAAPHAYLAHEYMLARTVPEAITAVRRSEFIPGNTVIVESTLSASLKPQEKGSIRTIRRTDTESVYEITNNPAPQLFITDDTYYPGWKASVDNVDTPIQPVNIKGRGVQVPSGDHIVRFTYHPITFTIGAIISGSTYIATISMVILLFFAGHRTVRGDVRQRMHHRHNRDR